VHVVEASLPALKDPDSQPTHIELTALFCMVVELVTLVVPDALEISGSGLLAIIPATHDVTV